MGPGYPRRSEECGQATPCPEPWFSQVSASHQRPNLGGPDSRGSVGQPGGGKTGLPLGPTCGWSHLILTAHLQGFSLCCSVAKPCLTLHHPMDCSMPVFPVPYHFPEFAPSSCPFNQWCHPTISSYAPSSPSTFSLSQHQGLFQWVSCSHQVSKVLELELQHRSSQWIHRWSPCSPTDSQESSPAPEFESITSSALSIFTVQLSHPYMTTGETIALTMWTSVDKVVSLLFNTLSRFVRAFLPRSSHLLISG